MGAVSLELVFVAPRLRTATPRAPVHRVLHPAAAPPIATRIHAKAARCFERGLRGIPLFVNVDAAPGAVGELVRDDPAAVVALGAGQVLGISPLLGPPAIRAVRPVALELP